jgi:hypothetical protein
LWHRLHELAEPRFWTIFKNWLSDMFHVVDGIKILSFSKVVNSLKAMPVPSNRDNLFVA